MAGRRCGRRLEGAPALAHGDRHAHARQWQECACYVVQVNQTACSIPLHREHGLTDDDNYSAERHESIAEHEPIGASHCANDGGSLPAGALEGLQGTHVVSWIVGDGAAGHRVRGVRGDPRGHLHR